MKNLSIRTKLTLWYTLMLMVFLFAGFAATYQVIQEELIRQSMADIYHDSAIIAEGIEYNEYRERLEFDMVDSEVERLTGGIIYALYSEDGRWLNGRLSGWVDNFDYEEGVIRTVSHEGMEWLLLDREAFHRDNAIGYVRVLLPLEHIHTILNKIFRIGLIAVAPFLILSWLGGLAIASGALRPVKQITRAAEGIANGDLARRIEAGTADDEVGHLAGMFNTMAESLENSFEREKQFSSDASHELRSPLSVIIGHSESALAADNIADYRGAMKMINTRGKEMQALLSRLLMFARGEEQLELSRFSLTELAEDLAEETSEHAAHKGITVKAIIAPDIICTADQMLLVQMLMNLAENAVKYTDPGGTVTITLIKEADEIRFTVADNGRGIAPDDLPYIFDRFYRADKARSVGSGSGLGLSIARRVAELHGGSISAESNESGACFHVVIPAQIC